MTVCFEGELLPVGCPSRVFCPLVASLPPPLITVDMLAGGNDLAIIVECEESRLTDMSLLIVLKRARILG